MRYYQGCMICGEELEYREKQFDIECEICHDTFKTNVACKNNHYVCDACHSQDALDVIFNMCMKCESTNPLEISMWLMEDYHVFLHGPEHHYLIPAALITAYCNKYEDKSTKKNRLLTAKERSSTVPGGFCGFYGACGSGIGCGIFASVITESTPLTTDSWGFANRMTGFVLYALGEIGGPRCCKRNGWYSIIKACEFLENETGKRLFDYKNAKPICIYKNKNTECLRLNCPFFLNKK